MFSSLPTREAGTAGTGPTATTEAEGDERRTVRAGRNVLALPGRRALLNECSASDAFFRFTSPPIRMTATLPTGVAVKHRILHFRQQLEHLKAGGVVPPKQLTVWPCYGCDFHCPGCCSNAENLAGWRFLDASALIRTLDEIIAMGGLQAFEIAGGGEPLYHREIERVLDEAYRRKLAVGTITNGTRLIREARLREKVLKHNRFVRVSVYPESDLNALARLAHEPREAKLGVKLLVGVRTVSFYLKALEQISAAPFDYLCMKAERDSPDDVALLQNDDVERIEHELRRICPRLEGSLRKTATTHHCYLTPVQAFIDALGDVYLCCLFHDRDETFKIGNIHAGQPFREMWEGERHRLGRERIDARTCNRWDCRWFGYLDEAERHLRGVPGLEPSHASQDDPEFI